MSTELGPRFFDVTKMYTPELRKLAMDLAPESGLGVHEGVYFFMTGPQFETPAEIRAIRRLGGDAVGMSTVTEALTAAHCGLPVLGSRGYHEHGCGRSRSSRSPARRSTKRAGASRRSSADIFARL
jgi:purine nucleoside phosphorylase